MWHGGLWDCAFLGIDGKVAISLYLIRIKQLRLSWLVVYDKAGSVMFSGCYRRKRAGQRFEHGWFWACYTLWKDLTVSEYEGWSHMSMFFSQHTFFRHISETSHRSAFLIDWQEIFWEILGLSDPEEVWFVWPKWVGFDLWERVMARLAILDSAYSWRLQNTKFWINQ